MPTAYHPHRAETAASVTVPVALMTKATANMTAVATASILALLVPAARSPARRAPGLRKLRRRVMPSRSSPAARSASPQVAVAGVPAALSRQRE